LWLDYLLILAGSGLSLFLTELGGLRVVRGDDVASTLGRSSLAVLPFLLLLPVGVILFWPAFYATQRVQGRTQGLTLGEWLWGVAWLLVLVLTAWIVWMHTGRAPEFVASHAFRRNVVVGYALAALSLGVIAVLITLTDLVGRWPHPWTHRFALVLLTWPALPLAALWALELQVAFHAPLP
jgi:hypothetical protein